MSKYAKSCWSSQIESVNTEIVVWVLTGVWLGLRFQQAWPMSLYIADIMMPTQEKVWTSLSEGSLMFIFRSAWLLRDITAHVHFGLPELLWCMMCLICNEQFFYCIPSASFGVSVLSFGIEAVFDFVYQIFFYLLTWTWKPWVCHF